MQGIITEVKGHRAVMLCTGGYFKEIKNRNYVPGQQVSVSAPVVRYAVAAACFLVLLTVGFSARYLVQTPVSYIYLDINPSLRLDINRFDRVVAVTPLNRDGEALAAAYRLKREDAGACIETILLCSAESGFLNEENNDVTIGVATPHKKLLRQVDSASEKFKSSGGAVAVSAVTKEENEQAVALNISYGKLKAVQAYTAAFGGNVSDNAKKLNNVAIPEIYQEIDCLVQPAEEKSDQDLRKNSPNEKNNGGKEQQKGEAKQQTAPPKNSKAPGSNSSDNNRTADANPGKTTFNPKADSKDNNSENSASNGTGKEKEKKDKNDKNEQKNKRPDKKQNKKG